MKYSIDTKAESRLKELLVNKKNGFVKIRHSYDLETILEIIRETVSNNIKSYSSLFKLTETSLPCVIRFGKGVPADIIPEDEIPANLTYCYCAEGLVKVFLSKNEAWRYKGIFIEHYDWTAKQWQEDYETYPTYTDSLGSIKQNPNPFKECFCCKKPFKDEDIVYSGFSEVKLNAFKMVFMCRKCAYSAADKVTDYDILPDGNIKVTEIKS